MSTLIHSRTGVKKEKLPKYKMNANTSFNIPSCLAWLVNSVKGKIN
jgi:hypothetical protein